MATAKKAPAKKAPAKKAPAKKPPASTVTRTIDTLASEVDMLTEEVRELRAALATERARDRVVGIVRSQLQGGRMSETLVTEKGKLFYRTLPRHQPTEPPEFTPGAPLKLD